MGIYKPTFVHVIAFLPFDLLQENLRNPLKLMTSCSLDASKNPSFALKGVKMLCFAYFCGS